MISLYTVKQFVTAPKTLFFLTFVTLLVPNVALCLTEHLSVLASMVNVLLPLGVYWLLMTLSGKPGKELKIRTFSGIQKYQVISAFAFYK